MAILGIWDGHDAGACLLDEHTNAIVCAVNEERFTRRKLEVGFPRLSIEACLAEAGMRPSELREVALSTFDVAKTLTRLFPGLKESYYQLRRRKVRPTALDPWKRALKYELTRLRPGAFTRAASRALVRRELARIGLGESRVHLVPHHQAHAACAAYTSGFDDALVVTLDGVGDGLSGSISRLRGGRLEPLSLIPAKHSLGIFYELVTRLLNMRELEDEGKVMALAAYGYAPSNGSDPLQGLFEVNELGLRCRYGPRALSRHLQRELAMVPSEQFAFLAQRLVEAKTAELVGNALRQTGARRVAYAGGVASNIQVNRRLRALPGLEKLFVFPHMGDGGLAMGAALARAAERDGAARFELGDLRLGPSPATGSAELALERAGLSPSRPKDLAGEAASRIERGRVLLWVQGRMEFGPRALGGRSILARADSLEIRDRLNLRLKRRVWYQPFCPSVLDEEAPRLFEGGEEPNRYMTVAYRVRNEAARRALQGVVGHDGTCRPQMVDERYGDFHRLLRALKAKTGTGAVLNTSCNLHGEPIVATADDAVRTFLASGADALVLEDAIVDAPSRSA